MSEETLNDTTEQTAEQTSTETNEQVTAEPTYEELTAQSKELSDKAEELRRSKLTDDERTAEDTAKAEAEAANQIPEEYQFTLPQDMPVDDEILNDFKPVAKELELPQGKAQKLVDLYAEKIAPAMMRRQAEAWQKTREDWVATAKADKEIGGDKWDATVQDAMRVVNTVGTPELKEAFNTYGLGDHPELIRTFARMAKYFKEPDMETGNPTGQSKSLAKTFYPEMEE